MAREEKAGLHVRVHELVVLGGGGVDEVLVVARTGVIDKDVDAAEGGERESHGSDCGVLVGGVSGVKDAASP